MLLISFPGGFLWQHWLMFAGPIWVLKMIKERQQVWILDGQRILFVSGHARPRLFFVQSLWFCLGGPTAQQRAFCYSSGRSEAYSELCFLVGWGVSRCKSKAESPCIG